MPARLGRTGLLLLLAVVLLLAAVALWVFRADWRWAVLAACVLGVVVVFDATRRPG